MNFIAFLFIFVFSFSAFALDETATVKANSAANSTQTTRKIGACPVPLANLSQSEHEDKDVTALWGALKLVTLKSQGDMCEKFSLSRAKNIPLQKIKDSFSEAYKDKLSPAFTRSIENCAPQNDDHGKVLVSRYYYSLAKLEQASSGLTDEIAAIDGTLPGSQMLSGVTCSLSFSQVNEKCGLYRKQCQPTDESQRQAFDALLALTQKNLALRAQYQQSLYSCERTFREGHEAHVKDMTIYSGPERHKECQPFADNISILESETPLIAATEFISVFKYGDPKNKDLVTKALIAQLQANRKALVEKSLQYRQAALCLQGTEINKEVCQPDNLSGTIASTPALVDDDGGDASKRLRNLLLHEQSCTEERGQDQLQTAHYIQGLADVGDTAVTGLLGFGALGKLAKGANVLKTLRTGENIIGAAAQAAVWGVNAVWFSESVVAAKKACGKEGAQIDQAMAQNDPQSICPKAASQVSQAMQSYDECIMAAGMAAMQAVPFLSPALRKLYATKIPSAKNIPTPKTAEVTYRPPPPAPARRITPPVVAKTPAVTAEPAVHTEHVAPPVETEVTPAPEAVPEKKTATAEQPKEKKPAPFPPASPEEMSLRKISKVGNLSYQKAGESIQDPELKKLFLTRDLSNDINNKDRYISVIRNYDGVPSRTACRILYVSKNGVVTVSDGEHIFALTRKELASAQISKEGKALFAKNDLVRVPGRPGRFENANAAKSTPEEAPTPQPRSIEDFDPAEKQRISAATKTLRRPLTSSEQLAVIKAQEYGQPRLKAGRFVYSAEDMQEKAKILEQEGGFSAAEASKLQKGSIVGTQGN